MLQGPVAPDIPPFAGLAPRMDHPPWSNPGEPGYLGLAHAPFTRFRNEQSSNANNLKFGGGSSGLSRDERTIVPARLTSRRRLLTQFDQLRRVFDRSDAMEGMEAYTKAHAQA